jgi:O-antigen/teichoic acid export membrane protein
VFSKFRSKSAKDIFYVMSTSIILKPVELLKGFFVAKYLGPDNFGIFKVLELIYMLKKYGSLGFNQVAIRESSDAKGRGNYNQAEFVKNVALSSEVVLSIVLLFAILAGVFFVEDSFVIFFILAAIGFFVSKIAGIMQATSIINKHFSFNSKVIIVSGLITSIFVIVSVPQLEIFAPIAAQIFAPLIIIVFYVKYYDNNFKFILDKKEFFRILKIGIPLAVGTLSLAGFKYAERVLALWLFGLTFLGYYGFAEMVYMQIVSFLKMPVKVRMVDIYQGIGNNNFIKVHKLVVRETRFLILVSLLLIFLAWHVIEFIVPLLLPEWIEAIHPTQLFLFVVPVQLISNYATNVLHSPLLNLQKITPIYRNITTLTFISMCLILDFFQLMTFEYFIILNIICYGLYNLFIAHLYKKYFYVKYILNI